LIVTDAFPRWRRTADGIDACDIQARLRVAEKGIAPIVTALSAQLRKVN